MGRAYLESLGEETVNVLGLKYKTIYKNMHYCVLIVTIIIIFTVNNRELTTL